MDARGKNNPIPDTSWYDDSALSFNLDTADQLAGLAQLVINGNDFAGKTINLTSDISLAAYRNGYGWTPISLGDAEGNLTPFEGTFDGKGHIISGLTINAPNASYNYGLFGSVDGGTVKNLGLINVNINVGQTGNRSTGGIMGFLGLSGTVENCFVTGTISGNNNVGGLVGWNHGNVKNCYFIGSVSGRDYVGGLVGVNNRTATEVSNCYAAGWGVRGRNFVGGLAGGTPYVSDSARILGSVALNQRIQRTSGASNNFGRVLGQTTGILNNNHGRADMVLPSGITIVSSKDGADVTNAGVRTWWETSGPGGPGWTVPDNKGAATESSPWWWGGSRPRLWFER